MTLTNRQLFGINTALNNASNAPIKGVVKFKLLKAKKALEDELQTVYESMKDSNEEEKKEILDEKNELDLPKFFEVELVDVELSINDLKALEPIIEQNKEEK